MTAVSPTVLVWGGDPPEPPAVLVWGADPPGPPAVLAWGADPPDPPAVLAWGNDPPAGLRLCLRLGERASGEFGTVFFSGHVRSPRLRRYRTSRPRRGVMAHHQRPPRLPGPARRPRPARPADPCDRRRVQRTRRRA